MKKRTLVALALGLAVATGAQADRALKFRAHLDGFNAAGQPVATNATGQARFEVIDGGTAVRYSVKVAGIENMFMAHIHVAPAPVAVTDPAGPIAYWFAPSTPPAAPGAGVSVAERIDGDLASGLIYSDQQLVGVLAPDPENPDGTGIRGLINAMMEGRASVVVHTNDFDPTTPPGVAGDSPPGEIRGTIE
ncbi:MAG: CHRD domain-containing protein [Ectothiorhodospiraceae bacterium]|nr:CHRD domain-containing protein [Chromatiales bacterium]MCP5153545.1 CHRD domain-containing protein [Ectothiorhodospiraceae bacterium]